MSGVAGLTKGGLRRGRWTGGVLAALVAALTSSGPAEAAPRKQPNVIFILVDDLRFDAIGALDPRLKTPNIDRLAKEGVLYRNAFVTTSLCSPSRATILTGRSARNHRIVGNEEPEPEGTVFFPSHLQRAGYRTAMIGKWHMGHGDHPRAGFDHWVSFPGQGVYLPSEAPDGVQMLNVDGRKVPQKGYITDELTDYAIDWLGNDDKRPFFLYLSHKGVHEVFTPAERHRGQYANLPVTTPPSAVPAPGTVIPRWVTTQRNSWHGLDYPYYGQRDLTALRRDYHATLSAIDDSIGRLMKTLRARKLDRDTVILFMGDNGFLFGEHGLIDKRNAYEESMRVPLIAWGPGLLPAGQQEEAIVANLDIAPTVLDMAGLAAPAEYEGASLMKLARGTPGKTPWRDHLIYEYYWEFALPHTPTTFAIRTDRYKYVTYHGIWDADELFDLNADPGEQRNLIFDPKHAAIRNRLRDQLYSEIRNSAGARVVPFAPKNRDGRVYRDADGPEPGDFPAQWLRKRQPASASQ